MKTRVLLDESAHGSLSSKEKFKNASHDQVLSKLLVSLRLQHNTIQ